MCGVRYCSFWKGFVIKLVLCNPYTYIAYIKCLHVYRVDTYMYTYNIVFYVVSAVHVFFTYRTGLRNLRELHV